MLWQSCTESNKKLVRRSQQATGSIRKCPKASGGVRELQGASGSIRKAQHPKIINKQTNTVTLKPKVDSKISTVKKHCQLKTSLIKGC